jgi:hypothetical protein
VSTSELAETGAVRPSLLRVLADAGAATEEELRLAFAEAMGTGERFGEVVLRRGWVDEHGLAAALAKQRGVPLLDDAEVDHDAVALLGGAAAAAAMGACPVNSADKRLLVAVAEPTEERFAAVRAALGVEPDFGVVTAAVLEHLVGIAAQVERAAERAVVEGRAARAAEEERHEASLHGLDQELEVATAQLVRLRERVGKLVAADERRQREVSGLRERVAQLEGELASRHGRIAAARKQLTELAETLDG